LKASFKCYQIKKKIELFCIILQSGIQYRDRYNSLAQSSWCAQTQTLAIKEHNVDQPTFGGHYYKWMKRKRF